MKTFLLSFLFLALNATTAIANTPELVDIDSYNSGILTEIRYFTENNFVGTKISGYNKGKCLLTTQAATSLVAAQQAFAQFGFKIKVFDCYRPQQAVDHFVRWAKDLKDTKMKAHFYPSVAKKDLFSKGYIAAKSGHSRGSTLDITLVDAKSEQALDMGTPWDYFSPLSWPQNQGLSQQVRANRMLLASVMQQHGFKGLQQEWWHFTLNKEPHPKTYYNVPIN